MDRGFPKTIQHHFPGIGSQVDAAFENYGELKHKKKQKNINNSISHFLMLFPFVFSPEKKFLSHF